MIQKKWELNEDNPLLAKRIAAELGITQITAQILINRGMVTAEEAQRFFDFDLHNLWDPFLFSGMELATERLIAAIKTGERIVVFGDYDVDGITGTSLLWRVLRKAGANVDYYIPDRSEGYGMNLQSVERIAQGGYTLIVTVDNGISCYAEIERANSLGLDVIVTDHHEPPEVIPPALAVLNPKILASGYPFSYLAGVGVGFKLCLALAVRLGSTGLEQYTLEQIDLVTLGTIADIVPLIGENRLIAANGLKRLQQTQNVGLQALINLAGLTDKEITAGHIGFVLGPRINAIGRLDNPTLGVELLTTDDPVYAQNLAEKLDQTNRKRQMLEETIVKSAIEQIEAVSMNEQYGLVLASEEWHHGVIGIAASKLVERYYRPTILIAIHQGIGKGSARGIRGLNLYAALTHCKEFLIGFGGHEMAAGLSIAPEQIAPFRQAFQQYVESVLQPDDLIPYLKVDQQVEVGDLNFDLLSELERLEPHGPKNPRPVLQLTRVQHQHSLVGANGDHLRLQVVSERGRVQGIAFGMGGRSTELRENQVIDVVFNLERNIWQNREYLQMMVTDLRPAELSFVERLYSSAGQYLTDIASDVEECTGDISKGIVKNPGSTKEAVLDLLDQHFEYRSEETVSAGVAHLLSGKNLLTVSGVNESGVQVMLTYSSYQTLYAKKVTCIFYPQWDLLRAEFRRYKRRLRALGVKAYIACGSMTPDEEKSFWEALERGELDILFTTPAYFALHLEKFKLLREPIGLCVLQEAQQLEQAYHTFTHGYEGFELLWQKLGRPQLLALAGALSDESAGELMARLHIHQVVLGAEMRSNLTLQNRRHEQDKLAYLHQLAGGEEKTLIFVNSPADCVDVAGCLRKTLIGREEAILFLHENLPETVQEEVLRRLACGASPVIVVSSGYTGKLRIPDIRHVVLYHLSCHYSEFLRQCRLAGVDSKKSTVHLLYNTYDRTAAEKALESSAPERDLLVKVYVLLEKLAGRSKEITLTPQGISVRLGAEGEQARAVENSLRILKELNLIELIEVCEQWKIRLLPKPQQKLDLSSSIRYNEGIVAKKFFAAFCQVALQETPEELLERIARPCLPVSYIVKEVDTDELS